MKALIRFFTRQSLFGDLLTIFIIGVGIAAAFLVRKEVFPNVSYDTVTVVTPFVGAAPSEVEQLITTPLERELKEVDGIKKMTSHSIESRSVIILQLDPDATDEEKAKSDMREVVDRFVAELPEGAEKPVVTSIESKQQPIIEVTVSGNVPELKLREVARDIENKLEAIPGVAKVNPFGIRDLEIRVRADLAKLRSYQLSLEDLVRSLRLQNIDISGGTIEVASPEDTTQELLVRTVGQFTDLESIKNTVIRANDLGRGFRVKDVAAVDYELARPIVLHHTGGLPSLRLTVLKKEQADAVKLVDAVKKRMGELTPTIDKDVKIHFVNDLSIFIRRRLSILTGNLGLGLGLVLLILALLLPWRVSFVVAMGEPFAFLGTLILFYWMGHSINLISMLGFIIVSGILVDDNIVVVENAVRLMQEGMSPTEAAVEGTYQVWPAMVASLMTTSVAFLPMMFMTGIFGKFTREIPIGVLLALIVSIYECFFILPGHVAHWVRIPKPSAAAQSPGLMVRMLATPMRLWEERAVPLYKALLHFCLSYRYLIVLGTIAFAALTGYVAIKKVRFILFPPEDVDIFMIRALAPNGTSLARTEKLLAPIEAAVAKLPENELDNFTTLVGQHAQDQFQIARRGSDCGQVTVYLTPSGKRQRDAADIIQALRKDVGLPPGLARVTFERVNPGPPVGKPLSVHLQGDTYEQILPAVKYMETMASELPGVSDVENSYIPGKEEIQVKINAAEAAAANLSVTTIGSTVRAAYEGIVATTVRETDEEIDVRVSLDDASRTSSAALRELSVPNALGQLIPLPRVTKLNPSKSLSAYDHEKGMRQVKVLGEIDTSVTSAQEVKGKLTPLLPQMKKLFPGVDIDFGGESADTEESMASLARAFGLAALGIFLILVATFRNLVQPFLVSLSIPLGLIAVVWVFLFHGKPLSFMAMLGVIALSGVIVNNSIVFIDFVNRERERGIAKRASIINAGGMRVRPIFLTMVTTVLGVLPTAYGIGGQDNFVVPIALALGWGLFFGSALSTFVTPSAIAIADDLGELADRVLPWRRKRLNDVIS